jgi:hypothetical protein
MAETTTFKNNLFPAHVFTIILYQGAASFTLVTDGQLHLRQALFPEAYRSAAVSYLRVGGLNKRNATG